MKTEVNSNWTLIKSFLKNRTTEPRKNPSYVLYFLIVIVLVGTFGIIKDLIEMNWCWSCGFDEEKVQSFCFNVTNISLSLVTASIIDLIFIKKKTVKNELSEGNNLQVESTKKSVRIFGLSSLIVIFVIWIIVNNFIDESKIKLAFSIFSLLFSYYIWWISSVRNKLLQDRSRFNPLVTLGEEKTTSEKTEAPNTAAENETSLMGNIKDFKVN